MKAIELIFSPEVSERIVLSALSKPDSGFRILTDHERSPLRSGIDLGVAVAGLIVSTAQLGLAIHQIKAARDDKKVDVELHRPDGSSAPIYGETPAEITEALEAASSV